jgi:putative MFS transporter
MARPQISSRKIFFAVLVASLGYCVDVFDIVLFSIYRVQTLQSLGLSKELVLSSGVYILNMQLVGMMIGGILWGVIGDKLGRLQVLFGSILLYSSASIVNAFIQDVDAYAWCRFVAGIGLA